MTRGTPLARTTSRTETHQSVRHKTLSSYYPNLNRLSDLIPIPLVRPDDEAEYVELVRSAIWALREQNGLSDRLVDLVNQRDGQHGYRRSHQELIDVIMEEVARRGKNVLSMTPRDEQSRYDESLPGRLHLTTPLHRPAFRALRSRIGDQAFRHLIVHTSIFLPVGSNSFVQITGLPVYDIHAGIAKGAGRVPVNGRKRKRETAKGQRKRSKGNAHGSGQAPGVLGNGQTPADVSIARQRMFYGHPAKTIDGRASPGLHPQHVLNEVSASDQVDEEACERLCRAIFPRYRFEGQPDRTRPVRTEQMLQQMRDLVDRHKAIDYASLLRRCIDRAHDPTVENLQPISQSQVGRYTTSVLRKLHGKTLLGSDHNLQVIRRHASRLISAKQFEPITLHSLLSDLRMSDFEWLSPPQSGRPALAASRKQKELVEQLIFWLFNEYLVPLLRNSFYITETASTRYETVYYSHDQWLKATQPHFAQLQQDFLEPLDFRQQAAISRNQLGVSAVRLIPKPNGFRPIVNLGRRAVGIRGVHARRGKKKQSANEALRGIHQVLTFEKDRHRDILGSSLFGTNEIFAPLQGLKHELLKLYGEIPRLYFVKMDIKAAFDTIKQDKVLRIVDSMLESDWGYALVQYCLLLPPASEASQGSARRLFKTRAVVEGNHVSTFDRLAREIARPLRNVVMVDMMRKQSRTRSELMSLLRQHIKQNIWQIGNRYFRQREGIPQGSKISSLLCSFFYAAMEREHLACLTKPGSRLLRYIDDFLYITDDFSTAKRFSALMSHGFADYGAFISTGKTMTSFEYTRGQVTPVCPLQPDGTSYFPYCGFSIDTKTLEVKPDVPRVITGDMEQSFALRSARHRGKAFVAWLSRQLENRNHIAYLDTTHNRVEVVHLNVWLNFAMTAMKIPHYFPKTEELSPHLARIVYESICASVGYTYIAGRARVRHAARDAPDGGRGNYMVQRRDFEYLAKSAVIRMLMRKAGRFKDVVHLLHVDLGRQEYRAMRLRHASVVARGWTQVQGARY